MKSRYLLLFFILVVFTWLYIITDAFIGRFLDIDSIQKIPQATVILDKNGNELYRFFDQDRSRVAYESISPFLVNAIIAAEDERFWVNDGTDVSSLMRAVLNNVGVLLSDWWQLQWWSTITQQIIKNIFLTKQKTIKRKLQELVLAKKLTTKRQRLHKDTYNLSDSQAFIKAKESIITAYLNYVYFGNHAYGVDAAARHYFRTNAKELSLLQSAILASMPQAPSLYNPIIDPTIVLWSRSVPLPTILRSKIQLLYESSHEFITQQPVQSTFVTIQDSIATGMTNYLREKPLQVKTSCLIDLKQWATWTWIFSDRYYTVGRKDRVLCRMWEQKMIDTEQLKQAFLSWSSLQLYKASFSMQAPHFIYWIKDFLLQLPEFTELSEQQFTQAWYQIRTTLDPQKQQYAQEANENYMGMLRRAGWSNRALLHIDSRNGDVLSYIWSVNFYDEVIHGQVDILRAMRQVWSTIKPFFYAYLFKHYPFAIDGSIVDWPLKQWPNNHDKAFRWKIDIATALASSRNLPVVRMFLALGGERVFLPYLRQLWFTSIDMKQQYSYALALWAVENTLIDLAQGYIQLSVTGTLYPTINPIQKIVDSKWTIMYQKSWKSNPKVIPDTVSDMLRTILSNKSYMPSDRWRLHQFPIQNIALKTGTTDKKQAWRIFPRDGLSVVYTAEDVIVTRAWNTDWTVMGPKAFGGEINHYVLKQYLQNLKNDAMIVDAPRVVETAYATGKYFAGVDRREEFTEEQKRLFWRF